MSINLNLENILLEVDRLQDELRVLNRERESAESCVAELRQVVERERREARETEAEVGRLREEVQVREGEARAAELTLESQQNSLALLRQVEAGDQSKLEQERRTNSRMEQQYWANIEQARRQLREKREELSRIPKVSSDTII